MLRVSYHPEAGRIVLSIWDHDVCMSTFRLAPEDVPELVRGLTTLLLPPEAEDTPITGPSTVAIPLPAPPKAASA